MTPERWTDTALDERFARIDQALSQHERAIALIADTSQRVAMLDSRLKSVADDAKECRDGVRGLTAQLQETADQLKAQELKQVQAKLDERAQLQRERVSDRRWLIGVVLTVLTLIVATISVLSATGVI